MSRLIRLLIAGLLLASTLATTVPAQGAPPLSVSLNPTTGLPGSATTVTGTGFTSGEPLQVAWYDSTVLANTSADSSGNLTASITIPSNASAGQHPIAVWDQSLNLPNPLAVAMFTVGSSPTPTPSATSTPSCPSQGQTSVTLNPTSGPPGTRVTANGNGWPAGESVSYSFAAQGGTTQADSNGTFAVAFTVPQDAATGGIGATFVGQSPCRISFSFGNAFTVTAPPTSTPTPSPALPANCAGDEAMSFNPSNPTTGQQVTISVTSAQPSTNVSLNGPHDAGAPSVQRGGKGYIWSWTWTPDAATQYSYGFTVNNGGICTSGMLTVAPAPQQSQPQPTSACAGDEVMIFSPANPTTGEQVTVSVTSAQASTLVGLNGPFNPSWDHLQQGGKGYIWFWTVTPDAPGAYSYSFTVSNGAATCTSKTVQVSGTAPTRTNPTPTPCQFVLGFKTIHDLIPDIVGDCLTNDFYNSTGDDSQNTKNGLLVWRKSDNFTAFTDGYRTWINGPNGLVERLNTCRFSWEANPDGLPSCDGTSVDPNFNYAGYVAAQAGAQYTDVQASWVAPKAKCGPNEVSDAGFWVGLGGITKDSPALEQTGVILSCNKGSVRYLAWYEMYPAPPVQFLDSPVSPGDQLHAEVNYRGNGIYALSVSNWTRGWNSLASLVKGSSDALARNTAEVIAERPSGNPLNMCPGAASNEICRVTDFGTVQFTDAHADGQPMMNGETMIEEVLYQAVPNSNPLARLYQPNLLGDVLAEPGSLSTDGTAFGVKWRNPGS